MSEEKSLNFIEEIIENDLKSGKYETLVTRFPQNQMVIYILAMLRRYA